LASESYAVEVDRSTHIVKTFAATYDAINHGVAFGRSSVSIIGAFGVVLQVHPGHDVAHTTVVEISNLVIAPVVDDPDDAVRLVIVGVGILAVAIMAEEEHAVPDAEGMRDRTALVEAGNDPHVVRACALEVTAPDRVHAGSSLLQPRTRTRGTGRKRGDAVQGDVPGVVWIPEMAQVEGRPVEVQGHLYVPGDVRPLLALGSNAVDREALPKGTAGPLSLAADILKVRGTVLVVDAIQGAEVSPEGADEVGTLVRMHPSRATVVANDLVFEDGE
jgi:hypothetical protein